MDSTISTDCSEANVSSGSQNLNASSEKDPLQSFMNSLYDESDDEFHVSYDDDDTFAAEAIIRNYDDKQPMDTNLLDYWYSKRFSNPILYKLAMVVHGVPATQVSVERCFSILRFIFSDYRTRLLPELLADIMFIRLNAEFT